MSLLLPFVARGNLNCFENMPIIRCLRKENNINSFHGLPIESEVFKKIQIKVCAIEEVNNPFQIIIMQCTPPTSPPPLTEEVRQNSLTLRIIIKNDQRMNRMLFYK